MFKDGVSGLAMPRRFAEAISIAERADVVIMCLGLDATLEGSRGRVKQYSGGDKPDLNLPGLQQELLEGSTKLTKPIVLVLLSGAPWH